MIIGLFSGLLSPGGVQRAGRHAAAVLAAFAAGRGASCRFLSLNDPPQLHKLWVGTQEFVFMGYGRNKARFVLAALRAARQRPILILAGHPNLAPVARAMKVFAPAVRTVVLAHGIEVWEPLGRLRRSSLALANRVIAASTYTAQQLTAVQGVAKNRIQLLPWALDPQFEMSPLSAPSNHLPREFPAGRVILTVGRWAANERYKGVDHLIQVLPSLLEAAPDLHLVAVGDGDDRARLEQLAVEKGVNNRVRFLAGLSPEELLACYRRCELFALPSSGEGFGMVFLEAMSQGKPVVGGAHGGTPDIVEDGATGLLVPYGDLTGLSRALGTLLADAPLREQMGRRGRERIERDYLFNRFSARFTEILSNLCAS